MTNFTYKVLILSFLLSSCTYNDESSISINSDGLNEVEPTSVILIEEDVVYKSTEENYVVSGGVDGSNFDIDSFGNVYILDRINSVIHKFNSDGVYTQQVSRNGNGPGEYKTLSSIDIYDDNMFIYDNTLSKILIYEVPSGNLKNEIILNPIDWIEKQGLREKILNKVYALNSSKILMRYSDNSNRSNGGVYRENLYALLNVESGVYTDSLFSQKQSMHLVVEPSYGITFPFFGKALIDVSVLGNIFTLWSEDSVIYKFDINGKNNGSITHKAERVVLDRNIILERYSNQRTPHYTAIRSIEIPNYWPAYENLIIDDLERIWVATRTINDQNLKWWVLSKNGQMIVSFNWPRYKEIEEIRNGFIYTRELNESAGESIVVRYTYNIS